MKKVLLTSLAFWFVTFGLLAQVKVTGVVKIADSETPLPAAKILLMQQNTYIMTNANGEFTISNIHGGTEELNISKAGYLTQIKTINIPENEELNVGVIYMQVDVQEDARQEAILQLSESDFSEDEGRSSQTISSNLSRSDVFLSQTSFSFSPMRFRMRGYDQDFESTYINGVHFNTLDRGGFNYSSLGGLNDAMRNKDVTMGLDANSFSYGNIGSNTNIVNRASAFAAGTKVSMAYSNRMYKLRGQATYATGILPSGWAFTISGLFRWADEGIQQGTFYNSAGYFLAAEKIFNPRHSLSLVTYGAPTQRGQAGAVTQEVYDLAGSIYYNPYWGYQDGKKRNSRVVKTYDPTAVLTHDFKISQNQRLRTGVAFHYNWYSNSALGFYNATDPRPDYYRNLPSFQTNAEDAKTIADMWRFENGKPLYPEVSQVDWNSLYAANLRNNLYPDRNAKYMVERRHSNLMESVLNSTYTNQLSKYLKLTAGIEGKYAKDMNYKTMEDMLGGVYWRDIDQFAERDFIEGDKLQNDLNNPDRSIQKGDIFGYHYDINILHGSAFLQNEWNLRRFDIYYAGKVTYTQFDRYGYMKNGRAPENSYGKGKTWWFVDPSVKGGIAYKPDGNNRIYANALVETRAPLPSGAYVSERIKDTRVPDLNSRKIFSADLNYMFNYQNTRGRITLFQTNVNGGTESTGYYDDGLRTFINYTLSKVNKVYRGMEVGVTGKINRSFSISATQMLSSYYYANDALGTMSFENGSKPDASEKVYTKGLKINTGPQLAANVTLDYFHPKMWFADITLNYFDNNYLDFAPDRFSESSMALYAKVPGAKEALGTQEKLKGGFLLDASLGKLIYLKNRKSLNFNLSLSNILNNTSLVTGGFQQGRMPVNEGVLDTEGLNKFPNKYYYAWGFNLFFHVGYKF